MEKKELKDLPALDVINSNKLIENTEYSYVSPDFGFVNDIKKTIVKMLHIDQPYRVHEGRLAIVDRGYVHLLVNLAEHIITPKHSYVIFPESIVQPLDFSDDLQARGLVATPNFVQFTENDDFFRHYLVNDANTDIALDDTDYTTMDLYFKLIWSIVSNGEFKHEMVQHLLMSLLSYYDDLRRRNSMKEAEHITHGQEVFRKFIDFVNKNSKTQRTVDFYADKLCLTPRYLNTLIRQTSGQTMMDWINRSTILEAKVLLKHSNKMIYEIADELHFPSASFFCKFFKKNTGMTPMEYQKS